MLTATFTQIPIQTCQNDCSHHGTLWLNELKWIRNATEGEKESSFCGAITLWEVWKIGRTAQTHTHTPVWIGQYPPLPYRVSTSPRHDTTVTNAAQTADAKRMLMTEVLSLFWRARFWILLRLFYAPKLRVHNVWSTKLWSYRRIYCDENITIRVLTQNKGPGMT